MDIRLGDDAVVVLDPAHGYAYKFCSEPYEYQVTLSFFNHWPGPHVPLILQTELLSDKMSFTKMELLQPVDPKDPKLNQFAAVVYAVNDGRDPQALPHHLLERSLFEHAFHVGWWARDNHLALDLTADNIMLRGDCMVTIDPFIRWKH